MASPEPTSTPGLFKMRPLSGRERTLLIVAFLVLYGVAFYFWVYQPFTEQISGLRVKLEEERTKLVAAQAIFHRLEEINAKIAELEAKMKELDLLVPGNNRAAHFIYACGQWERSTGAKVRDMVFEAPQDTGGYFEYMVKFRVVGTYASQVKFLSKLEAMDRLVRVDNVSLVPEDTELESASGGGGEAGAAEGASPVPSPEFAVSDVVTADYTVHLFVDPSKAAEAAKEEPGAGLDLDLPEGRITPFLP